MADTSDLLEDYNIIKAKAANNKIRKMTDAEIIALGYEISSLATNVELTLKENGDDADYHSKLYHIRQAADMMNDVATVKKKEKEEYVKELDFRFGYYFKDIKYLINKLANSNTSQ